MTSHTTEQERAEFEAWYIAGARKAVPAFAEWSEIEIREGCMRPDSGSYRIDSARIAWDAWQAARRSSVAPQPASDAQQGWTPVSERLPDFMDFCDWLMPMTDAKRERWILANESMATASVPGLATHWRKAYALPELMAAEPRQKKSNSPEFDGIKTVPQAQEKQQ